MYVAGFAGQQAGAVGGFDYSGPKEAFNAVSLIGHAAMAVAVVLAAVTALGSLATGPQTGSNPWGQEEQ
jgi:heme/copper-type cytochrome/quinol oxidase subunit 1